MEKAKCQRCVTLCFSDSYGSVKIYLFYLLWIYTLRLLCLKIYFSRIRLYGTRTLHWQYNELLGYSNPLAEPCAIRSLFYQSSSTPLPFASSLHHCNWAVLTSSAVTCAISALDAASTEIHCKVCS